MAVSEIPEPVASFIEAVNRHDRSAFLDAFTVSAIVDDWGRVFTTRQAIKQWSDAEFIGAGGLISPESVETSGATVVVVCGWSSAYADRRSTFTFRIEGASIAAMTIREG